MMKLVSQKNCFHSNVGGATTTTASTTGGITTTTTAAKTTTTKKGATTTTTTTRTTTTVTTTTTPYVYRNTVLPPTQDSMIPSTPMCGVLPAGGKLSSVTACTCDPPNAQLNKKFKFQFSWSKNLSDPTTPDFKAAKLNFEEQVPI